MAEAAASSTAQYRFESDQDYLTRCGTSCTIVLLAPVAQLVEASVLGTEGCQFESDLEYAVLSKRGGKVELLVGFLLWLGPLGVIGGFLVFMAMKKNWNWSTIIVSVLFGLILGATTPGLGNAVQDGVENIVTSIANSQ